jgi:SSS family solute:Na+ symporter
MWKLTESSLGAILLFGVNVWDLVILVLFLVATMTVGFVVSRGVKKEADFYLGGRKLGRLLQFFLNFGNSTDATGAVTISTAVYKDGASGIWLGFQTLFITPFFWFTQPWWRRARLVTMGDLFVDRFNSKALASAYAAFNIFMALFTMGMGNFFAYQVAQAMIVKPPSAYTDRDRRQIAMYQEYQGLKAQLESGKVEVGQTERFKYLDSLSKKKELQSFVSYLKPLYFFISYSAIVGIYIVLGGLRAAAITDAVQGLLILAMSIMLIPVGLYRTGGFAGLHRMVPEYLFNAIGTITWHSILAITFASLVQIFGLLHNMSTAGSAKDEMTARFGMICGGFTKRLVLIAWMLCGLIAIAVLSGNLKISGPDYAWGSLSRQLLPAGLMGLMLSGMLLGNMPSMGVYAVSVAGLATRNIYQPLVKGKSEKHYFRAGQWAIGGVLVIAVIFAMCSSDVISAYTMLVTFNTFFGAAVFLILFWRRLTSASILAGLGVWVVMMGIVPWILPLAPWFRRAPALLLETNQTTTMTTTGATAEDLAAGTARRIGQAIRKPKVVGPMAVFFDSVARVDPTDPNSPREGIGRFSVENYSLYLLGVPVRQFTSAAMTTSRWAFDGVFPFVMLIVFSLLTKPDELERADRFFAKMRTPVAPTPELDRREVELSYKAPHRFDGQKILRGSNWQFTRWSRSDVLGFFGCWMIVCAILIVLWGVLHIGSQS